MTLDGIVLLEGSKADDAKASKQISDTFGETFWAECELFCQQGVDLMVDRSTDFFVELILPLVHDFKLFSVKAVRRIGAFTVFLDIWCILVSLRLVLIFFGNIDDEFGFLYATFYTEDTDT